MSPLTLLIALIVVAAPVVLALRHIYRPTRPRPKGAQTLPTVVHKGFHDHRKRDDPRKRDAALAREGAPDVGQAVKVKINLREGLAAQGGGDAVESFAMGGRIVQVRSHNQVSVDLVASGDAYPRAFRGNWRGVLERRDEMEFPWVLSELRPVS